MSIISSFMKDKEAILGHPEPTLTQRPKRKMTPLALSLVLIASALSLSRTLYSAHATVAEKPAVSYAICSKQGQNVYTVDAANTKAECLVVEDSLVAATGTLEHVQATWPSLEVKFIPEGSILVPGISESHCHIMGYGLYRQIPLETGRNIPDTETVSFVRDYILGNPDILNDTDKVVDGWGWDYTVWPEGRFPSAADLDADPIIKGRPVMLRSKDGHGTWVSGRVLDSIQDIPDTIEGGSIIRDEAGNPVGVFLDRAQLLLDDPVPTEQDYERRFLATVEDAHANGLTSLHDAKLDFSMLDYFKRKAESGLPIRLYGMTNYDDETTYWGNLTKPTMLTPDHRFSARSVKLVGDGSMRTGGAALYEPYSDNPSTSGFMRVSEETLNQVIPWFLRDGWQVNVHAIGDRANGIVLDSLESALEGVDVAALRPRLEHAQIMREQDMKRVGEIGVIASVQPTHVIDDMWYAEERIGPERLKGLYAFRSLLDNGARLTLGSDFPVASMNPMATFYAAITRVSLDGTSPQGPGGFFPEQRLTRLEALRGMTIDPAYASFTESVLGSLEPGKHADFVVLSQDIMDIPVTSILDTKVLATVIDGKPVYGTI